MAVRSYLIRFSTEIPVTLDDSEVVDGEFFSQIISRAQEVIDYMDMNQCKYNLAVISHVNETEE